jgi:hypothetical protein
LTEEKTKLEGMIQSHDEMIMEMGDECGLNCMGEDANDDDGGDAAAPPATAPPSFPVPHVAARVVVVIEEEDPVEIVPEQEAPEVHEVILVDAEPESPQPRLFTTIMRDYKESPSRVMDVLDDPTVALVK